MTRKLTRPVLPGEHGAWAVLSVPLAVGAAAAGRFSQDVALYMLSSLFLFLGHVPARTLMTHRFAKPQDPAKVGRASLWMVIYLGAAAAAALPLLAGGFWLLLPLAAAAGGVFLGTFILGRRLPKSVSGDLLAVLGLTLGAPGAYYVATGTLGSAGLELWLYTFLFFGCSVFYVHMKIAAVASGKSALSLGERMTAGRLTLACHVAVILIVLLLVLSRATPSIMFLAFAPMTIHAVWGTFRLAPKVHFQRLGFILLGQALVFGVVLSVAMTGA